MHLRQLHTFQENPLHVLGVFKAHVSIHLLNSRLPMTAEATVLGQVAGDLLVINQGVPVLLGHMSNESHPHVTASKMVKILCRQCCVHGTGELQDESSLRGVLTCTAFSVGVVALPCGECLKAQGTLWQTLHWWWVGVKGSHLSLIVVCCSMQSKLLECVTCVWTVLTLQFVLTGKSWWCRHGTCGSDSVMHLIDHGSCIIKVLPLNQVCDVCGQCIDGSGMDALLKGLNRLLQ